MIGIGFLWYLVQWPLLFYISLGLAAGLPSIILYRREKRSEEGAQNVSPSQREQALERYVQGVKAGIVEDTTG